MSIIKKGTDFGPTEQVTSTKLDNLVDNASFTDTSANAVAYTGSTGTCLQGGGLEVTTAGQLQIQDGEVDLVKLSTNNQLNSGLYGVLDKVYPVGSIYISTVSTNPDALMFGDNGDTTWVAFGAGRTLVGINSADTDFNTSEETGGVKEVSLTASQSGLKNHTHSFRLTGDSTPNSGSNGGFVTGSSGFTASGTTGSASATSGSQIGGTSSSSGSAHTNLQPYIVTYMWKRTA